MKSSMLVLFLGAPGSGKSTFARQLANKLNAVRLNGDSMRFALFGSAEGIAAARKSLGRDQVSRQTFNAINYVVEQVLESGTSVVYDARLNKYDMRTKLITLAKGCGVTPVIVWVQAPDDIARKRTQDREQTADQPKYTDQELEEVMRRHALNFEEPREGEPVIPIDGTVGFRDQYKSFKKQAKRFGV